MTPCCQSNGIAQNTCVPLDVSLLVVGKLAKLEQSRRNRATRDPQFDPIRKCRFDVTVRERDYRGNAIDGRPNRGEHFPAPAIRRNKVPWLPSSCERVACLEDLLAGRTLCHVVDG